MNESRMLERDLAEWMAHQRTSAAPAGLFDDVVEATSRRRPAPRWLAVLREPAMRTPTATLVGVRGRRLVILGVVTVALLASMVALALVGALLQPRPVASDDWLGYRGDAAHGGITSRGPVGQPSVAWTFKANGAADTAIAIVGDRVVAGTDDGVVHVLSLSTGVEEWHARLDGAVGNPYVLDGVVYVADTAGAVHALDLAGGIERWQRRTTFRGPLDATVADGSLFVSGGPDGVLAALDPAAGALRWHAPVGATTSPAFDDSSIYEAGGGFRSLDAATGETRWVDDTGNEVLGAASVANGVAYLGASHDPPFGRLRAVDSRTGSVLWQADRLSSPTVVDGVAYAGSGDGEVSARDAVTGRELWRASLPGVTREPAFAGGILYIVSEGDSSVRALDAATGRERWRVGIGDQLVCCIAVAKGRIVVGSRTGTIYALAGDGVIEGPPTAGPSTSATTPVSSAVASPTPLPTASGPATLTGSFVWSKSAPGEMFNWPNAVAVDPGGRSWVADPWNDRFAVFESDGSFVGYWAAPRSGDGHFRLNRPNTDGYGGIAFAPDGGIYVLDVGDRRVVEFDAHRTFIRAWGGFGSSPGTFLDPVAIAVGNDGSVYVFDDQRGVVERFKPNGDLTSTIAAFGNTTGPGFNKGNGLAVDEGGDVYVGLDETDQVVEFDPTGRRVQVIGGRGSGHPLPCTGSMAVDADRRIYVACYGVAIYDRTGAYVADIGSNNGDARLTYAAGIALDRQGSLYVVDAGDVGGGNLSDGHLKKYAVPISAPTP